jgi:phosphate transport system protein
MTAHFVSLLDDLRRRSLRMASQVEDLLYEACEVIFECDPELAGRVMRRDEEIDAAEVEVEAEVIRLLALYQPVGVDLRLLCTILKVNSDLERVADCAVNMAERARHEEVQPLTRQIPEMKQLAPVVRQILRDAIEAYSNDDAEQAYRVGEQDAAIDALHGQIVRHVVANADRSPESMRALLDVLSIAKNLERIADHATNIAEDVVFLSTGEIVRHQFRP